MTEFLLNNKLVKTDAHEGMVLLDFIRGHKKLKGTKSACREGDCGSCAVIVGTIKDECIDYQAITSCITPLGNMHGKLVITIEGLNNAEISSIQQVLVDTAAIQCGYCTPGIVISLTAYVLSNTAYNFEAAKDAVGGNICRCTGYKSIERAIHLLLNDLDSKAIDGKLDELVSHNYVPGFFSQAKAKLEGVKRRNSDESNIQIIGGGTDLYVQRPDEMLEVFPRLVSNESSLTSINFDGNKCKVGAACKITDLIENDVLRNTIPNFEKAISLIASKLIRNIATIAGNLVNASPIGDLSILFLALNADLELEFSNKAIRTVKLNQFFKNYKDIDLLKGEIVKSIIFELPSAKAKFNFEKVSKRKYLDIATVNSAILIEVDDDKVINTQVSIGGVAAIPLYLKKTCEMLIGKKVDAKLIQEATKVLDNEISPISDVRGSAEYKRLLARQLFYAHFLELFPELMENLEIKT